ncbi:helix-turn-helix domain-containing protein [Streptomyces sp. NPDC058475]|uniref:AlbA family DNA-binding domain-containing protein n=1 Tax=Streptomyces sp. NPDC058475 TaxID=3346518 RepID=UPI003650F5AA
MPISLDLAKPFRSPLQIRELIRAIHEAGEHDENDWIEWKSTYDLTQKETKATLSRHIIAMANRMPAKSAAIAGGCGYIIVGVEPGNVTGVSTIDLADLESGMRPYLGHQGPEWIPTYATFEGRDILVISVEPPREGDPIHTLHKDFSKYTAGMIFTRRAAQTVQAGPGEVAQLAARTHKSESRQALQLAEPTESVSVPTWLWLNSRLGAILDEERDEVEKGSKPRPVQGGLAAFVQTSRDSRTEDDYKREVEAYVERYREYLYAAAYVRYVQQGYGALRLKIRNTEERSYQNVRLEADLPSQVTVLVAEDYSEEPEAPRRPIPLGEQQFSIQGDLYNSLRFAGPEPSIHLRVENGKILCDIKVIRAEEDVTLPTIHLVLHEDCTGEAIDMPWSITAINAVGRTRGVIIVTQDGDLAPANSGDAAE